MLAPTASALEKDLTLAALLEQPLEAAPAPAAADAPAAAADVPEQVPLWNICQAHVLRYPGTNLSTATCCCCITGSPKAGLEFTVLTKRQPC